MRMGRLVISALAAALLVGLPLVAQQFENVPEAKPATPVPTGAAVKIGVINVQAAMARTQEGRKASEELETRFSPRQSELEKLQQEIQALEERLRTQERTLSDDARLEIARQVEQKRKQGTRLQQDLQDDVQNAQADYINQIGGKMQQIIDRYAREKSLNVIFNISPGGPIIYATAAVDITEDIIRLYDQTHPVETAAGTQPPAAQNKRPQP